MTCITDCLKTLIPGGREKREPTYESTPAESSRMIISKKMQIQLRERFQFRLDLQNQLFMNRPGLPCHLSPELLKLLGIKSRIPPQLFTEAIEIICINATICIGPHA